jgi:hypothetical protein
MQDSSAPKAPAGATAWDWQNRAAAAAAAAVHEVAEARRRGIIGLVVGSAVAFGVYRVLHRPVVAAVVAGIALLLALLAFASPRTLYRAVLRGFDRFAHAVGTLVTWLLMTLLVYLLFFPAGLILKAGRKLGISTRYDPRAPSYWSRPKRPPGTLETYRRQF